VISSRSVFNCWFGLAFRFRVCIIAGDLSGRVRRFERARSFENINDVFW
jgi:hypothetical protein